MTADTIGGVWNYSLELARGLAPWGAQIALATMGAPLSRDQRAEVAGLENVDLFESRFKLCWMESPWDDVAAAGEWLLGLAREIRPDLVHLNDYPHGVLPWSAPVLMVGHSCVFSWHAAVRGQPADAAWDDYRQVVSAGLQSAQMVVAPTQAMLGELDRYYGPLPRGRMIPNGRNPADYGAAPKEPFVLSAGRIWDEAKNLQALSRAAPGLVWPVSVAGDARHPNGGERPLAGITHLGRLSSRELAGWFARAAIYALPARYEPFGLSILEAALSGCALVLGDLPSLREIWGEAATFVAPDDPLALVQAINHLAAAPAERAESAARSLARARQLTADRLAEGYVEAYGELLGLQPLETLQGKACRKCAS